jgi:hypothetical protein
MTRGIFVVLGPMIYFGLMDLSMTTLIPRLSACGVAYMQYLDGVARDLIEQFVGILNERYHVNAGTLFDHLRAFWLPPNAPLDGVESLLKRPGYGRIVVSE